MARYAKIDRRMYADEKYRRLTQPAPCGQVLWWHLLAGRQAGIIPGLCSIGESAFAEQLNWPLRGFRAAFREVMREKMVEVDWQARVVWVPNAIRYNSPHNPNVVRSWGDSWDELPECELKVKAWNHLKGFMESLGKGFAEAFRQACPNHSANHSPIQEQEQEQEQEQYKNPPTPRGGAHDTLPPIPDSLSVPEFGAAWTDWTQHLRERRRRMTPTQAAAKLADLAAMGPDRSVAAIRRSIANGWVTIHEDTARPPANGTAPRPAEPYKSAEQKLAEVRAREAAETP